MTTNFGQLTADSTTKTLTAIATLVGRHPDNTLVIQHPSVSKFHTVIEFDDRNQATIIDQGSLNGTYVDEQKIEGQKKIELSSGSHVRFGLDPRVFKFINFSIEQNKETFNNGTARFKEDKNQAATDRNSQNGAMFTLGNQKSTGENSRPEQSTAGNLGIGSLSQGIKFINTVRGFGATNSNLNIDQSNPVGFKSQLDDEKATSNIQHSIGNAVFQLEKEVEGYSNKIKEQEQQFKAQKSQIDELEIIASKKQELGRLQGTKQGALEKYIIEMQRKFTELERANESKQEEIEELCARDWARNLDTMKLEQRHLDRIIKEKSLELQNIQKYTSSLLHGNGGSPNMQMLEEQSKELSLMKRQLVSNQNRNNECQRQWKGLYEENLRMDDHLKGLRLQIERQNELYQQLFTEFDKKYFDAQNVTASILKNARSGTDLHDEASEFLVNSVQTVQEENDDFQLDNTELRRNYEDLSVEVGKLQGQKSYFDGAFEQKTVGDQSSQKALIQMRQRVYELLDLAEEFKIYSIAQEKHDLEDLKSFLEEKLLRMRNINNKVAVRVESIQNSRTNNGDGNTVEFFAKLLEQKENKIQVLLKEQLAAQESLKQSTTQVQELGSKLQGLTGMCFDIEHAQKKISDLVFSQKEAQGPSIIQNEVVTQNNVYYDQHLINENPGIKSASGGYKVTHLH